jgi:hypothetical protein
MNSRFSPVAEVVVESGRRAAQVVSEAKTPHARLLLGDESAAARRCFTVLLVRDMLTQTVCQSVYGSVKSVRLSILKMYFRILQVNLKKLA